MFRTWIVLFRLPDHPRFFIFLESLNGGGTNVGNCHLVMYVAAVRMFCGCDSQTLSTIPQLETHWLSQHWQSRLQGHSVQTHSAVVGSLQEVPVPLDSQRQLIPAAICMRLERTWYATVATRTRRCCRRVPPRKSAGACLNTACTYDVVASQKSMHCTDVPAVL